MLTDFLPPMIIREWLNGSLFPLSFFLTIIVGIHIKEVVVRVGYGWQHIQGMNTACVLFWVFLADSWRAGITWILLRMVNDGVHPPTWMADVTNTLYIGAAIVSFGAMLRAIYVFTPDRWGHAYWLASLAFTLAFLLLSHFNPQINF